MQETAQHSPNQPEPIILYRVDPSKNMQRFYRLSLDRDLFGFWLLVNEWGRIGRPGQMRLRAFDSRTTAENAREKIANQKLKRGYLHK